MKFHRSACSLHVPFFFLLLLNSVAQVSNDNGKTVDNFLPGAELPVNWSYFVIVKMKTHRFLVEMSSKNIEKVAG